VSVILDPTCPERTGGRIVTFTNLSIRLPSETLEQIDEAIERVHPALTDRQEFVEMALEWAIANMNEEAEKQNDDR
jgi:hypothetical protein